MKNYAFKIFILLLLFMFSCDVVHAHVTQTELSAMNEGEIFFTYLKLGFLHILPLGLDHILFVLSLFFLNTKLKAIIWQASAFTVAHTITLGLSLFQIISAPPHLVEPLIALSIAFVAIENMISDKLRAGRIVIVFIFGLVHGMGFAGVLKDLGLPEQDFMNAIISFNVGVELGQLCVILLAWGLLAKWFRNKEWYRKGIVVPISALIAVIAIFWTVERTFFT